MRSMRYRCDQSTGRCWMNEHVARLGVFDGAFSSSNRMFGFTDADGLAERNGRLLLLEVKAPSADIPTGQQVMFEKATRLLGSDFQVLVVWGRPDFVGHLEAQVWIDGTPSSRVFI